MVEAISPVEYLRPAHKKIEPQRQVTLLKKQAQFLCVPSGHSSVGYKVRAAPQIQLGTRRSLALNCLGGGSVRFSALLTGNYDNLSGAAGWARESLEAHANDQREWTYSVQELEEAKTHEDLWNAAQLQLVW